MLCFTSRTCTVLIIYIVIPILNYGWFIEAQKLDLPPPPQRREPSSKSQDDDHVAIAGSRKAAVGEETGTQPPPDQRQNPDRPLLAPFDTDIRNDCRSILIHCQSEVFTHVYLQCPALCTKYLQQEGMKGTADHDPEALYAVGTLRTFQGPRIDADRFEGYVTVISLLPLLPGMAFYYYEMMETLHDQFGRKVEFVIIPIDVGEGIHIKPRPKPKVVILEEESAIETHPWVQYLVSIKPRSGAATKNHREEVVQLDLPTDRLTVYIVSADGYFIERMTVPTMAALQRTIAIYLKTMGYEDL